MLISSLVVTSWFYSVYNIVTSWVNFTEKSFHEHELQLPDYDMGKYFCPNVQISARKMYFLNFCLAIFQGQMLKLSIIPEINIFGSKYFPRL